MEWESVADEAGLSEPPASGAGCCGGAATKDGDSQFLHAVL